MAELWRHHVSSGAKNARNKAFWCSLMKLVSSSWNQVRKINFPPRIMSGGKMKGKAERIGISSKTKHFNKIVLWLEILLERMMHARPTPHQHYASPVFWFGHRCDWIWRGSRDAVAGVSDRLGSAHRFVTLVLFAQRLLQLQCFCKLIILTFIKCSSMKQSKASQLSPPLNASGCSFFTVSFNCLKNQQREMLKENRVHNRVCGWYWWQ